MAKLTTRQRDVIRLIRQGYSQKETARTLGIAYGTVRKHTLAARERTGCRTTAQIVAAAAAERDE